jgi:hypothetical protein
MGNCGNKPNFDTHTTMYTKKNGDVLSNSIKYNTPPQNPLIIYHKTTKYGVINITEDEYNEEIRVDNKKK